jgi:hypothetical protein
MGVSAVVGSAVVGGAMSADASRKASHTQADSQKYAADLQYQAFQEQQAAQKPWLDAGQGALTQLNAGTAPGGEFAKPYTLADYQSGPQAGLFDFTKNQAMEAMKNQMGGQNLTTNAITGAGNLATNLATQSYNTGFNQNLAQEQMRLGSLQSLTGQGQTATGQVNADIANRAGNMGGAAINAGNANAAGTMGQANAWGKAIGGATSDITTMNTLSQIFGGSSGIGANGGMSPQTMAVNSGPAWGSAQAGYDYAGGVMPGSIPSTLG